MNKKFYKDFLTMTGRNFKHLLREPEALIMTVMLPIMIYIIFVVLFAGAIDTGSSEYVSFVFPGVLITGIVFGLAPTAIEVNNDMNKGVIERFRTMNISKMAILNSHAFMSVIKATISLTVLYITSLLFGYRITASFTELLVMLAVLALVVTALSWVAIFFGLIADSPEAASSYLMIFQFTPYLSSAYVPIETMPNWLQGFAEYQPFNLVTETLRSLLNGGGTGDKFLLTIIVWGGMILLFMPLALKSYNRSVAS